MHWIVLVRLMVIVVVAVVQTRMVYLWIAQRYEMRVKLQECRRVLMV